MNATPAIVSQVLASTNALTNAARPNAPTAPYSPSATAAPMPVASPAGQPRSIERWIVSRPIGPTGAAIESPISID